MKKYELTADSINWCGRKLYRIRACKDFTTPFGIVKTGDLGGFVEKEDNLSQEDNAWIFDNAKVCDKAEVYDNAIIRGEARVYGKAEVYDNAKVYDNAIIRGEAIVGGEARVYDEAEVCGNAKVCGEADIYKPTHVLTIGAIGSRKDFTTFYRDKENEISVKCGCFCNKIDEFLQRVSETHGENKHAQVYKKAVELAKLQIELEDN